MWGMYSCRRATYRSPSIAARVSWWCARHVAALSAGCLAAAAACVVGLVVAVWTR